MERNNKKCKIIAAVAVCLLAGAAVGAYLLFSDAKSIVSKYVISEVKNNLLEYSAELKEQEPSELMGTLGLVGIDDEKTVLVGDYALGDTVAEDDEPKLLLLVTGLTDEEMEENYKILRAYLDAMMAYWGEGAGYDLYNSAILEKQDGCVVLILGEDKGTIKDLLEM